MATWALGDVQGCFATLSRLLRRIGYRRGEDRLILLGDLVNRGPDSLGVLRWARGQGDSLAVVLGNHDLHLLACRAGVRPPGRRDTLQPLLAAPDADELCAWLAKQPFLHRERGFLAVHAGFLPSWTETGLANAAATAAAALRNDPGAFLRALYRRRAAEPAPAPPAAAVPDPGSAGEAARNARVLTGIRLVDRRGRPDFGFDGAPETIPPGRRPWFEAAAIPEDRTVLFGHWSALGLTVGERAVCLDSGCVWNGFLTAMRLEDGALRMEPTAPGDGRPP